MELVSSNNFAPGTEWTIHHHAFKQSVVVIEYRSGDAMQHVLVVRDHESDDCSDLIVETKQGPDGHRLGCIPGRPPIEVLVIEGIDDKE